MKKKHCLFALVPVAAFAHVLLIPEVGRAVELSLRVGEGQQDLSPAIQIVLLLTVLSLAPAIIMMMTSFTRIVVVLALLKQAMGTHQMPPGQVLIGLAVFLTVFIMTPVWSEVHKEALNPYLEKQISEKEALERAVVPIRSFMLRQTREKDIMLFLKLTKTDRPKQPSDISLSVLIPSFMISELKTAFEIGFVIYIPFLLLDMIVASVLLSMGMMMLPPMMISLPMKLMLFVLVDGWNLMVISIIKSFG
jgi:flagellar biosynthetic protein FliP